MIEKYVHKKSKNFYYKAVIQTIPQKNYKKEPYSNCRKKSQLKRKKTCKGCKKQGLFEKGRVNFTMMDCGW